MTVLKQDRIDLTMMYTTHHANRRDLDRLVSTAAVDKDSRSSVSDGLEGASATLASSSAPFEVR
jgi:hypothetical protein